MDTIIAWGEHLKNKQYNNTQWILMKPTLCPLCLSLKISKNKFFFHEHNKTQIAAALLASRQREEEILFVQRFHSLGFHKKL